MGINATNNLNRNELTSIAKQNVPNIPVVAPAYSSTGWTAGDFLYQSATGVNPAPSGVGSVGGPITTLQATNVTVSNGGLFSATQTLTSLFATTAVYTGPTTTVNTPFFNILPSATAVNGSNYCVTLINGNIVIAYYDSAAATPGYYYAIYNPSGIVVLAPTLIAANGSTGQMISAVAESSGNFRIFYWDNTPLAVICNEYTPAGTLVNSVSAGGANQPTARTVTRTIELVNGNVVLGYWDQFFQVYIIGVNSTNTSVLFNSGIGGGPNTRATQGFALYPFPATMTATLVNGFGITWYSANAGNSYFASWDANCNFQVGTTSTPAIWYDSIDIVRLQDGTYMSARGSSGASVLNQVVTLATGDGTPNLTGTSVSRGYNQVQNVKIIPMAGSGFALLSNNTSNQLMFVRSSGLTSSPTLLGANVFIASVNSSNTFCAACGTNGFIYTTFLNGSSENRFIGVATAVLTNGTTYTATSLVPPSTTFFGIAETTVSAGQTGNVIVSGTATANGSMPSITGTQYFDTTQTPMFGNKGFVTGRNFTLKGFE